MQNEVTEQLKRRCLSKASRAITRLALAGVFFAMSACFDNQDAAVQPGSFAEIPIDTTLQARVANNEFQQDLVADNVLTFSEYQSMYAALNQCVTEAGGHFSEESMLMVNGVYFVVIISPDGARDQCSDKYWLPLAEEWSLRHPVPESVLQAANASLAQCLRERGIELHSEHPTADDFRPLWQGNAPTAQVFRECATRVAAEFQLPPVFRGA